MHCIYQKDLYNVPFTVPVNYKGYAAIMTRKMFDNDNFNNPFPDGSIPFKFNSVVWLLLLVPIGVFCKWGKEHGIDINFTYLSQDSANINVAGVCTGAQGISYDVDTEEVPLNGCGKNVKVTELG
jgi:hypothetical protein